MAYLYVAKQLIFILFFAISAYIVAKSIFRSSLGFTPLEEVAILTPVGIGVHVLALFFLGLTGNLDAISILIYLGVLLLFASCRLRSPLPRLGSALKKCSLAQFIECLTPVRVAIAFIAALALLPLLLNPAAPPTTSDEIRYHLPYALHFVEQGAITPDLYLRFPFHTLNVNLLYALALLFGDDVTPHYVHLLLGLLTALNLYVLARRLTNRFVALCSCFFLLTTSSFAHLAARGYVDLAPACFILSTIVCFGCYRREHRWPLLACAAILLGTALGSKYLALALLPVLAAWAYWQTRSTRDVVLFITAGLVFGLPWYLYNLAHTGNPIWPASGEFLGHWPWSLDDLTRHAKHLSGLGTGQSFLDLLMLPYNLWFNLGEFGGRLPSLAFIMFGGFFLLPWWSKELKPYGLMLIVVILGWFYSVQSIRYLAPIWPIWCFLSVWAFTKAIGFLVCRVLPLANPKAKWERRVRSAAKATVVLVVAGHYDVSARLVIPDEIEYLISARESFLDRKLPEYGVVRYIRDSGRRDETIYQMECWALLSYVRDNRVIGDWFGIRSYNYLWEKYRDSPEGLIQELAMEEGVSSIAASKNHLKHRQAWADYFLAELSVEYEDEHVLLFNVPTRSLHEQSTDSVRRLNRTRSSKISLITRWEVCWGSRGEKGRWPTILRCPAHPAVSIR